MTSEHPNILWICTDQQRYDTIHALGNPIIRTPNLDRLCAEGVAFTHAYCQNPICTPSRTSFLTGLYPSTVHGNINGNARCNLPENARLVTARLRDAGYDCGLSGKIHLASAWEGEEERVDDGYRRFWYSHSGTQDHNSANQYWTWLKSIGRFDEVMDTSNHRPEVRSGVKYHKDIPPELHQTSWCCDRAIEFMNEERSGPWLISVNTFDPHPAYDAPASLVADIDPDTMPKPPFKDSDLEIQAKLSSHVFQKKPRVPDEAQQQRTANYYAMIELIDQNVGRLLDELEQTNQRKNTVIIFMSDHGQLLGDHGLENKGCRFYEGLVRVPLIISWPGNFEPGLRSDGLVELTDIAPTLCDIVDIDPGWTHGQSLLPILTGQSDRDHHRDFIRCEFYNVLDMNWNQGIDLFDLVMVAGQFGKNGAGLSGDVNGDSSVNIFDLVMVAGNFGKSNVAAAPTVLANKLTFTTLQKWNIQSAIVELEGIPARSQAEELVLSLLTAMLPDRLPEQTQLLPNYPNPFNPETWIPFELSQASKVSVTIYDLVGTPVRAISMGYLEAGRYVSQSSAVYWDGKTDTGERVASGTYFYTLKTDMCSATQKMIILK